MDSNNFIFIENDHKDTLLQFLENTYQEINIQRTLIIVKDNESVKEVSDILKKEGHSVYTQFCLNILLDLNLFLKSLKRIYVIPYNYFTTYNDFILMYIIPNTNLFITHGLSEKEEDTSIELLLYSETSGHLNKSLTNYIWIN